MGGTVGKTLLAALLTALLALAAAGCGGSDDSGTTAAATAGQTAPSGEQAGDDRGAPEQEAGDDKGGDQESGDDSSSASGGSGGSSAGEGSAAFRTKGGDNSIQDFGDEADEDEREAAEANLAAYFEARAQGDWKKSCEYLAEGAVKPLEQLAESSPQLKGKGCAAIVGALSASLPAPSLASPLVEGVAALRIEGDQGFALFHGRRGTDFFIPLAKEGDEWKVGSLSASEFP